MMKNHELNILPKEVSQYTINGNVKLKKYTIRRAKDRDFKAWVTNNYTVDEFPLTIEGNQKEDHNFPQVFAKLPFWFNIIEA